MTATMRGLAAGTSRFGFSLMSLAVAGAFGLVLGRTGSPTVALLLTAMLASATLGLVVIKQAGTATLTLVLMTGAAFTITANGLRVGGALTVGDLFLALAFGLAAVSRLVRSRIAVAGYPPFLFATSTIFLGGLIGSFFASNFATGLFELMRFGVSTIGVLGVFALWAPGRRELRVLTWAFTSGTAANALFGILIGGPGRLEGLTLHPNHLGMACLLAFGAAVGLVLTTRGRPKALACGLCAVLGASLILSGSRAALAGFLVAALTVLVLTRSWHLVRAAILLTVIAAAALLVGVLRLPETSAVTRAAGDPTAQAADEERAVYLAVTLERIEAHPLTGSGFDYATLAHSVYLQVLASSGLIGLLGYLAVGGLVVRIAWHSGATNDRWLAGTVASYVGFLAAAAASNLFWDRWLWLYLALIVALSANPAQPPAALHPGASSEPLALAGAKNGQLAASGRPA